MPANSPRTPPMLLRKSTGVNRRVRRIELKASSLNLKDSFVMLSNLESFSLQISNYYCSFKLNSLAFTQLWLPYLNVVTDWITWRQTRTRSKHSGRSMICKIFNNRIAAVQVFVRDATNSRVSITNNIERNTIARVQEVFRETFDFAVFFRVDFKEPQFSFSFKVTRPISWLQCLQTFVRS